MNLFSLILAAMFLPTFAFAGGSSGGGVGTAQAMYDEISLEDPYFGCYTEFKDLATATRNCPAGAVALKNYFTEKWICNCTRISIDERRSIETDWAKRRAEHDERVSRESRSQSFPQQRSAVDFN